MQVRTLKYLVAVGGLALTAACADDQPATVTMPSRPALAFAAAGCDFTGMKQDARAYFASNQDPVYDLISQFSSLNTKGTAANFKAKGFEILSRVATVAGTSAALPSPAAGDTFVRDVLTCLGFTTTSGQFTAALGANGLFGVPSGSAAVVSRGSPVYGAEPRTTTTTWANSVAGGIQFLLYGYPRDFQFTAETPAQTTAAELATIPAGLTFNPQIRAFFCEADGTNPKLQHENEILENEQVNYCLGLGLTNPDQSRGVLAFMHHVTDWFAPRPLFAVAALKGVTGGGIGGLSPIGSVDFNVSSAKLAFVIQPTDGTINKNLKPFTVSASTANNTPIDGVTITLTVYNNQGTPVAFSGNVATTTNGGIATFDKFQTTKAGGYIITASGTISGGSTKTTNSNLFNVQGKK